MCYYIVCSHDTSVENITRRCWQMEQRWYQYYIGLVVGRGQQGIESPHVPPALASMSICSSSSLESKHTFTHAISVFLFRSVMGFSILSLHSRFCLLGSGFYISAFCREQCYLRFGLFLSGQFLLVMSLVTCQVLQTDILLLLCRGGCSYHKGSIPENRCCPTQTRHTCPSPAMVVVRLLPLNSFSPGRHLQVRFLFP